MFSISEEDIISFIERFFDRWLYITLAGVVVSYIIKCFFVDEKKIKEMLKRGKEKEISQEII